MIIDTTQITQRVEEIDGDSVVWACYSHEDIYVEIPVHIADSEEHLISMIDNAVFRSLHQDAFEALTSKTSHSDDVFSDQQLVRQDRPLAQVTLSDDELALIPEEAVDVVVGRYTGYRPPYNGSGLSIYDQRRPPDSLLSSLGLTEDDFEARLHTWYAIKKLDDSQQILYKLVEEYSLSHGGPTLPNLALPLFTAKIYTPNGEVDDHVDFFFAASKESMALWCQENNLMYPAPESETTTPWCFGIVWNSVSNEIVTLKAYIPRDD